MATAASNPEVLEHEVSEELITGGALAAVTASEISQQVSTAKRYPRSLTTFRRKAAELVTLDQETAASCIYALPRGKEKNPQTGAWERKIVKGPTVHFAQAIAYAWGNMRCGARLVGEDEQFVTAQGLCFDAEANVAVSFEVKRRIVDSEGRRYSPDMIGVTANAACSIALRNAILRVVPQPIWKGLYLAAEQTIMGDRKTLVDRRQAMLDLFKPFGLTPALVCQLAGVSGTAEIGGEELVTLQGMLTSLRDGEATVESLLSEVQGGTVAEKNKATLEDVKSKYRGKTPAAPAEDVKEAAKAAQAKVEAKRASVAEPPAEKKTPELSEEGLPMGENW